MIVSHSPFTMRAAIVERVDGPFTMVDTPRPMPRRGQVLVRIHASGVNPLDAKIRAGRAPHARQPLPSILGLDMAGVVEEVAPGVTRLRPGDAVYGMVGGVGGLPGTLAEYATADADLLAIKPAALSMREAAAVPLASITAWEGLMDRARLQHGQRLLVQGGAGGVGHAAVQIGLAMGARVYATVRGRDAASLRGLGAIPIDFEAESVDAYVARLTAGEGFDVVYDTGGGPLLDAAFRAVRRHGHVVSALGWGSHSLAPLSFKGASYSGVFTLMPLLEGAGWAHHGEILGQMAALAEAGRFRPRLDPRTFMLDSVRDAHDALVDSTARGKLVVSLELSPAGHVSGREAGSAA